MQNSKSDKVIYLNSCNYCGKTIKEEWKFCPFCKTQVETFKCAFCSREIKAGWNYCPYCKGEVKPEQKISQRVDKCNEWLRDLFKK